MQKWESKVTEEQAQARPNDSVQKLVFDAGRVAKFALPYEGALVKLGIEKGLPQAVAALAGNLEVKEDQWQQSRRRVIGAAREKKRQDLTALRSRALEALRFAWRNDPKGMAKIATIEEGDRSIADLASDGTALARALRSDPKVLQIDPKLKGAPEKLEALVAALTEAPDGPDSAAMTARNVAAVALEAALGELEAGLDFLTRDDPAARHRYLRRAPKRTKKPVPAPAGATA